MKVELKNKMIKKEKMKNKVFIITIKKWKKSKIEGAKAAVQQPQPL